MRALTTETKSDIKAYLSAITQRKDIICRGVHYHNDDIEFLEQMAAQYGIATLKMIFTKSNAVPTTKYIGDFKCKQCGAISTIDNLSQTAFLDYIYAKFRRRRWGIQGFICAGCKLADQNQQQEKERYIKQNYEKQKTENTSCFINQYLDPNKSWMDKIKLSQRYKILSNCCVDWESIAKHIQSLKYNEFLETPYWKAIASWKKLQCDFKCELCNSKKNIKTHHKTYDNHGYESHNLNDLIVLCGVCHSRHHEILGKEIENANS